MLGLSRFVLRHQGAMLRVPAPAPAAQPGSRADAGLRP